MPTYEYECKSCGHNFDVFQNMSDEPVKVCPECGSEVRRLIRGGTGVIFKGSGFYVTDKNAGGASSKVKKDDKAPATAEAGKTGTDKPGSAGAAHAEAGKSAAEAGKSTADTGKSAGAPKPKTETGAA